MVSTPSSEA
jgi:hypothetical protein